MLEMFNLKGKCAIGSGGSRGLGRGMAEGLLEAGASVVILGSSQKVEESVQAFKKQGFSCAGMVVDLSRTEECKRVFDQAVELLGDLDILVNAAGIQRRYACTEFPLEDWESVMKLNLTVPFLLSQMAAGKFLAKKNPGGKIINIASMLSFFGGQTVPAYAASKGGIAQLTKAMCNELAGKGINVNAIAPGYMDTEMNAALTDPSNPRYREITARIPAGRWGTPEDVKGITVFLASSASDYLNGAVIPVDGGYLVK